MLSKNPGWPNYSRSTNLSKGKGFGVPGSSKRERRVIKDNNEHASYTIELAFVKIPRFS